MDRRQPGGARLVRGLVRVLGRRIGGGPGGGLGGGLGGTGLRRGDRRVGLLDQPGYPLHDLVQAAAERPTAA